MMKRLVFLLLLGPAALAQVETEKAQESKDSTVAKIHYFYAFRSGMLSGCADCPFQGYLAFSGTTVHGIRIHNKLSIAVGTGVNSYPYMRVVPIFGSLTFNLSPPKLKNKLYAEFNYGTGRPLLGKYGREEYGLQRAACGRLVETALGYSLAYFKMKVNFLVGYHFQRTTKYFEYPNSRWLDGVMVALEPNKRYVTADLSRIFVSLGVGWR